jgi:transposase
MLVIIWQLSRTGAFHQDPGPDYNIRRDPEHTKRRALQQLANLGYKVTIEAA